MKMGSPAVKSDLKRAGKSTSPSSSSICMTTSIAKENFIESNLFSWFRLFRFASMLSRMEY